VHVYSAFCAFSTTIRQAQPRVLLVKAYQFVFVFIRHEPDVNGILGGGFSYLANVTGLKSLEEVIND
jgi:hypothetical protein